MANALREAWKAGRKTVNGWLSIPSGYVAELMAGVGLDSVTVDLQHGLQDYASTLACFQAMGSGGPLPMARIPWNEPGIVGKLLDAGAMGLICPMVNTPEEARAFVSACRYPPLGARSYGPIRAGLYGERSRYFETANEDVLCLPMVETGQAVDNLDAILDVPGVDGIYVGPTDLGISLGILPPIMERPDDALLPIYDRLIAACHARGKFIGLHATTGAYVRRMHAMGFDYATLGSDATNMVLGLRGQLEAVRAG